MSGKITKYYDDLYLINLTPNISGFNDFLGAWVFRKKENIFLIDPGPASTVYQLKKGLKELDIEKIDYILLTHIHIDHAGSAGKLIDLFPESFIISHNKAISHLNKPDALWKGSLKTLHNIAIKYGEIKSVDKKRLIDAEKFSSEYIKIINTPGHAPHHISFITERYLFAGEALGVSFSINDREYTRPATPPKLFLDEAVQSIKKLIGAAPDMICYGHLGLKKDGIKRLNSHINQLYLWKEVIESEIENLGAEIFFTKCMESLLKNDAYLAGFNDLNINMKKREEFFIKNSIKGFAGYLTDLK